MGENIDTLKPIILHEDSYNYADLKKLKKEYKIWRIINIYEIQLKELFQIFYPHLISSPRYSDEVNKFIKEKIMKKKPTGNWIYFPWNGNLVHMVNEEEFFLLRTNRNKNLITHNEQKILYKSCVGIVGLSVGSGIALSLAYQGIAKDLKLAEFDTLDTTNLNRIRAKITDVGTPKIDITTTQLYDINPYNNLTLFKEGLTKKNVKEFIHKKPKPQIIFEIIDDFEMKIILRLEARKAGIPVVMVANLGDSILVDVERYDMNKSLPLFNGILGDLPEEILKKPNADKHAYAVKIVGIENVPKKALESVKEINKTLVGRPQLSNTVTVSGAICSFIAKQFLLGNSLPSGRRVISLSKNLEK